LGVKEGSITMWRLWEVTLESPCLATILNIEAKITS